MNTTFPGENSDCADSVDSCEIHEAIRRRAEEIYFGAARFRAMTMKIGHMRSGRSRHEIAAQASRSAGTQSSSE